MLSPTPQLPQPPQPVPTPSRNTRSTKNTLPHYNLNVPPGSRTGVSPLSYGPNVMSGISFTDGGGFSFERSSGIKVLGSGSAGPSSNGAGPSSYGARYYGYGGDSPIIPFSTSITMAEPSSFLASSSSFNLPAGASSYQRRSYAAAAAAKRDQRPTYNGLSTSFASMSFQPMSFGTSYNQPMSLGTSYSKGQVHSLMATRSDAEYTKTYDCCGQTHNGLHALLEHVEDAHPFNDPDVDPNVGFTPMTHAMNLDMDMDEVDAPPAASDKGSSNRSSISPNPVPNYPLPPNVSKPSTPTAELPPSTLKISDVLTSPPDVDTTLTQANVSRQSSSSCSSPPDALNTPATSTLPSPVFATPKIASRSGFPTRPAAHVTQKHFDRAFNEVVAGGRKEDPSKKIPGPTAVAPGVLFASAVAGLGLPTNAPVAGAPATNDPISTEGEASGSKLAEPALPQPSLFTTHKPWRCPNPGCNKAYKQSNGLKYHQQKGQCDFAIHDAVDLGLSMEEAEERSRPFICAVGAGCTKRYRQMNGLKYHYLNSGDHGQYGLRLINNGTHPHPPSLPPPKRTFIGYTPPTPAHTNTNTSNTAISHPATTSHNQNRSTPYTIPSQNGSIKPGIPRMGIWPTKGFTKPLPKPELPPQRGRDAVLFAAVGNDPLDVNGRLEI